MARFVRLLRRLLFFFTGLALLGLLALAVLYWLIAPRLPDVQELRNVELQVPLAIYTQDAKLIALIGETRRFPVAIEDVPDRVKNAFIAIEDARFYEHPGIDWRGITRAVWLLATTDDRRVPGGSTITQQVARQFFLSAEYSYTRKLTEIFLALKMERELGKDEILELYLNKSFFGNRAYGVAAAADYYYGKSLDELTLAQAATLASIPKFPSSGNPIINPDRALVRRNYVLLRMREEGMITPAQEQAARAEPMDASPHEPKVEVDAPYVAEMVRAEMEQRYGAEATTSGLSVYTTLDGAHQAAAARSVQAGLLEYDRRHGWRGPAGHESISRKSETTLLDELLKEYSTVGGLLPAIVTFTDEKMAIAYIQDGTRVELGLPAMSWAARYIDEDTVGPAPKRVTEVLRLGDVVYLERLPEDQWRLAQIPDVEGAFIALDPRNGAILALSGGFDFRNQNNHVTQARRQPGSGFKPFIYSAALDKGFTPASLVSGAPIVVEDVSLEDEWRPEDYSRKFFGPTRLRKALALSLNLVAVRLLRAITPEYAVEYMARFGFDPAKLPKTPSLTLGTAEATPMQMAEAFAVFANGGYRIQNHLIQRIEDAKHNVLEQANPIVVCPNCPAPKNDDPAKVAPRFAQRVISAENAFLMTSMLRDTIAYGTAQAANVLNRKDLAGKTGTTNDHRDAWFNGYNSELVAVSWIGFDQNTPLGKGETGGRAALPMWIDYMRVVLDGVPEKPLVPPPGIVTATIDRDTGKPSAPGPNSMLEYFIEGTVDSSTDVLEGGGTTPAPAPDSVREGLF